MSLQDPDVVAEERRHWEVLAKMLGWRLIGFSGFYHATYDTKGGVIQINADQRLDIVAAIAARDALIAEQAKKIRQFSLDNQK